MRIWQGDGARLAGASRTRRNARLCAHVTTRRVRRGVQAASRGRRAHRRARQHAASPDNRRPSTSGRRVKRVLDVNLTGPSCAAAPSRRHGEGQYWRIVNIASVAGMRAIERVSYSAFEAGLYAPPSRSQWLARAVSSTASPRRAKTRFSKISAHINTAAQFQESLREREEIERWFAVASATSRFHAGGRLWVARHVLNPTRAEVQKHLHSSAPSKKRTRHDNKNHRCAARWFGREDIYASSTARGPRPAACARPGRRPPVIGI